MSTSPTTGGTDEPQGVIPPYEKDESDKIQDAPISASSGKTGPVSEGREVSDDERDGVGDTDMAPEGALGVGESINTRGEEQGGGQGSGKEGEKGASGRPHGSHGDKASGVGEQRTVTDTTMPGEPGDQGG